MKNAAVFVNSSINLLFAIQLKKTLFPNDRFDLILSSLAPGLEEASKRKELNELFENVYYVDYNKLTKRIKVEALIRPRILFEKMLGEKFKEYTDIFFWNPTLFLYFYIFEMRNRNKKIEFHLYGDAMGAYVCDVPICGKLFKQEYIEKYLKYRFDFKPISKFEYDYYLIGKEYVSFTSNRKIIDVPKIDISDINYIKYLNKVFGYSENEAKKINKKYIFMDVVHKDKFGTSDMGIKYMQALTNIVPNNEFAVKPHPRQNVEIYKSINNVQLIEFSIPWEVYCINNDISGKIIITFGSSSAFLPFIYTKANYSVICIDLPSSFNTIYKNEWRKFIDVLRINNSIYLVYSPDELEDVVRKIISK